MTTHILHSAHTCVQGKHLCLCCLWASVWAAELGASDGDSPGEMALMQMMPLDITQMLANFTNDATKHLSDANFTLTLSCLNLTYYTHWPNNHNRQPNPMLKSDEYNFLRLRYINIIQIYWLILILHCKPLTMSFQS